MGATNSPLASETAGGRPQRAPPKARSSDEAELAASLAAQRLLLLAVLRALLPALLQGLRRILKAFLFLDLALLFVNYARSTYLLTLRRGEGATWMG